MSRFKLNYEKLIEAIDLISRLKPDVTQYYVGKILFFADREHLLDFGRPITGDRYVAMEYGPVPSVTRNLLRKDSFFPDEILALFDSKIAIDEIGNRQQISSKQATPFEYLTQSDIQYLTEATEEYINLSFGELREISHNDPAYEEAWDKLGNNNEIDITIWLKELESPELAKKQLNEKASLGV